MKRYAHIAFVLLLTVSMAGSARAEMVWNFDPSGGTVSVSDPGALRTLAPFPIPYFYDETGGTVYYFNDDGSVKAIVHVPEVRVPRVSDDGTAIFLHEDIPFTSCGIKGDVEVLNDRGDTLVVGTYPLIPYQKIVRTEDGPLFFQVGSRDYPTLFLDGSLKSVQRYPFRVYLYVLSPSKRRIICVAADQKTLRDRFGSIRNDNYIVGFDCSGALLWQHEIDGLYVPRSMRMNGEETLVHFTYLDELENLHLVTYDPAGEKLFEKTLDGFGDVTISRIANNRFATFIDGTVQIYRYPDIVLLSSFTTMKLTDQSTGGSFLAHQDGIAMSENGDISLKYYSTDTETMRVVIFDKNGDLLLDRPNLEHRYNRWNGRMAYRNGLYVLLSNGVTAEIQKIY